MTETGSVADVSCRAAIFVGVWCVANYIRP